MATRTGRLSQNLNLSGPINVAGTVPAKADLIGLKKGRVGGRKPLGDLSNTGKPVNQADGKKALGGSLNSGKPSLKPKNLTVIRNDEAVSAKAKNLEGNQTIANKASDKSRTSSRKALSDISNNGKPQVPEMKNKNSLKPRSLREEPFDPSAIAEEMFLHNHQECIKSQMGAMDAHQFFKKVGLENDSDDDFTIASELPAISKMKYEIENARMEFEEVPEHIPEMGSLFAQPGSPEHCKTPKLSSGCSMWDDFAVDFKLIGSPLLFKN